MRTHFYKFIFIVISLCTLATTNAWAKYVYIDVTKLLEADAPNNSGYSYVTGKYYVHNMRIHAGNQKIELDSTQLLNIYNRRLYKANIPDGATSWKISTVQSSNQSTYIFYHPADEATIQYQTDKTYNNKYIIKQVQWDGTNNAGEVVHMIGIVTGGLIYFDNSITNWPAPIQMVIGHGSYARTYTLKNISNTKWYYVNLDKKDAEWADATYFAFINTEKDHILKETSPEKAVLIDGVSNTDIYRTPTELFKGSKYIFKPDSAKEKTTMTCTQVAPTEFNITQKVKVRNHNEASYSVVEKEKDWPATFTLKTYTLNTDTTSKLNTQNGKAILTSPSVYEGSTTFSYASLDAENYQFDGWGTGQPTATGNSYQNNYSQETTMYAFFTKKYQLTFSAQTGGTMTAQAGNTSLTSGNHVVGGKITLTATPNTGYYFVKWIDGNDNQLSTSATYTHTLSADITIKAVFNNTYTVTLNNQGANSAGTDRVTATYGAAMPSIANNLPKKTGYTFNGYFDATSGGTKYYNANGTSACHWNKTSNTTLYAKWTVNQYTVTWKLNGGQWQGGGTDDRVNNHNYGEEVTRPVDPSRTGYTFTGWSPAEIPETMPAENLEFTAQWTPTPYTVTWKLGEAEYATSIVNIENSLSTAPKNPNDGDLGCCADKFMGWSSQQSPSAGDVFTKDNIPANVITAKTYYAVFATAAQGVGTSIADFSEMGYENGTAVTDPIVLGDGEGHGDATITLEKAPSSSNAPTYYTDGEAVRIYAGGTITIVSKYNNATIKNIVFTFAGNDVVGENTITANSGTYDNGTWTGDANTVTFTIGGSTGHRRIASIEVTTGVDGNQYTNYVTQCTTLPNPALSGGSVSAIDVDCGDFSTLSNSQAIVFSTMQDLTCPVTFEVIEEGDFLISTAKDRAAQYQSKITVTPTKSGDNIGKLKNVYVRANATDHNTDFTGSIKVTSDEIAEDVIINLTADVTCEAFTITTVDHLGNETEFGTYFAGEVIATRPTPSSDACTAGYTFDGWSTSEVEYGSLIYNKVSFPYTMPAEDVTLYPVYQCNKTEDYHRVTSDLGANNWAGDYLIAYSDQIFADGYFSGTSEGSLGDKMHIFNPNKTAENLVGDVVKADWGDNYYITLETVEGGYVLKSRYNKTGNGKIYNYYTNNTNESGQISVTDSPKTAAKYAIQVVFVSQNDIRLSLSGNAAGAVFRYGSTGFRFYKNCGGNPIYLYRKSPLYTTSLICGTIETEATPMVTSTAGQTVKVNVPITLTASLGNNTTITGTSDNAAFTVTALNDITAGDHTIAVNYTPTKTTDGIETANITLKASAGNNASTTFQVTGRHLPENFVIATKVGATWYALPANMNGATNPEGVVIDVDETNMTAIAPNTTVYTLFPVKTTNTQYDRFANYGDRVRFSAVNNGSKGLWTTSDGTTINNGAQIASKSDGGTTDNTNPSYEWKITTTIVNGNWQYTLQTDQPNNQKYLRYWTAASGGAKWGTYANGNDELYFLPVTETKPFDYKVVEWYPTKVLIQTDAAITNPIVKIGGILIDHVTCTNKGGKLYEISGLSLAENPTKVLTLSYTADEVTYTNSKVVPIILSRETMTISGEPFASLTKEVYKYADLVVRDGARLTMDGIQEANTLWDVTIYPTSKISVPESKKLTVHSLTFFGGIDDIYDGEKYTTNKYGVPQLSLKGNLGKTVTTMDYIMRVDLEQMYQMGVPYDVNLNEITYWDGTSIELGSQLYVSAYDGQARANRDKKTWVYETDFETRFGSATLKAGVGYTISAEPQSNGDEYSILRMPMKSNIASGSSEEAKTINVVAYDNEKGVTITDNHKGWNYLSNPYMTTISGGEADTKLVLGYLKETGTGPWEWVETTQRYVTIPMDNGKDYYQKKFSEAELKPFKSFFVQIAQGGELSFALASRQNAPARLLQQETTPSEIEFELLLSNATQSDNTGLLISEEYTPAYEINADLEKMMSAMSIYTIYNGYNLAYNALSPINAQEQIPVGYIIPAEGEYTLELDPNSDLDAIKHIYLMDYDMGVTTDLINDAYTFYAADTKSDKRFAINIELSSDIENKPTGFEDVGLEGQRSYKFIYDGILYIMNNGVIYSTTGQQLNTMDK